MGRRSGSSILGFVALFAITFTWLPVADHTALDTRLDSDPASSFLSEAIKNKRAFRLKRSEELAGRLARISARKSTTTSSTVYTVKSGDTISEIWSRFGSTLTGALEAENAFKDADSPSLRVGEELTFTTTPENQILTVERTLSDGKRIILTREDEATYSSRVIVPEIIEDERVVSGSINSSLVAAASASDIPYSVIDDFVEIFGSKIEFQRDLQPGDTFTIAYTDRRTDNGVELDPGPIRAAAITNGGKLLAAVHQAGKDNKSYYFDQNGQIIGNYFLRYPVAFSRISSVFSDSRLHPVLKIRRPHHGVDFAAPVGAPVKAAADGIIESAGYSQSGGNTVRIKHNGRYSTAYLHLSSISRGIRSGSRVSRGQIIGAVGMTGLASGPHLHFSLYDSGRYVDPLHANLPMLAPSGVRIPPAYLARTLDLLKGEHQKVLAALKSDKAAVS